MAFILAVDDSPSMRKMVSFTLKGAGYQVVEAVDGVDAYEKAQVQSFDLVLTDQNMPRLDGLGLTRKLREHPQFKTVPILVLTTESSDLMKQAGRAAGATGWLVKPFDPARLLEVIKKVIKSWALLALNGIATRSRLTCQRHSNLGAARRVTSI